MDTETEEALEILEVTTSVLVGLRDDLREVGGFDQKVFEALYLLEEAITARVAELEGE